MISKKYENFHFKYYGEFDVSELKEHVLNNVQFKRNKEKNKYELYRDDPSLYGKIGKFKAADTNAVCLSSVPFDWNGTKPLILKYEYDDIILSALVKPIVEKLKEYIDGTEGDVWMNCMDPYGEASGHNDTGFYFENMRRFHIPISTGKNVIYNVDKTSIYIPEGSCYELNNTKFHSIVNNSNIYRINLIVDIIPNSILKELYEKQ